MVVVVVLAASAVAAFQLLSTLKGWQQMRRWRSKRRWRDIPLYGRMFALVCVVVGLAAGVLLAAAGHGSH